MEDSLLDRSFVGVQETTLFDDLTVSENLEYACRLRLPSSVPNHQVRRNDRPTEALYSGFRLGLRGTF